jgi:hypothetical protein
LNAAPVQTFEGAAPEREVREPSPPREHPVEAHESAPPHEPAPIAHFEPTPKPDSKQPYVVWSSAPPPEPTGGGRGPEE